MEAGTPGQAPKAKRARRHLYRHRDVNGGQASFATGLNAYKLIWVFIIGSFLGVVFETLYVYFMDGVWMRRSGMLYGPFNQVYGFGAVLFTLLLYRFRKKNAFVIFLAAAIIGLAFEYACSWVQQLAFGSVSWEYSDMPLNIGGRTNLFYAAGWGLMGFMFITHTWPFLSEMIERIPNSIVLRRLIPAHTIRITGQSLSIVCAAALAANLALSGLAVFRAGRRDEGVPPATFVGCWLDDAYPDELMAEKYPSMTFVGRLSPENSGAS